MVGGRNRRFALMGDQAKKSRSLREYPCDLLYRDSRDCLLLILSPPEKVLNFLLRLFLHFFLYGFLRGSGL